MPDYTDLVTFKEYIREDTNARDTTLILALDAAESLVVGFPDGLLGRSLGETTLVEEFAAFEAIALEYPTDVTGVTVNYTDTDGAAQVLASSVYTLIDAGILRLNYDQTYPEKEGFVSVSYTVQMPSIPSAVIGSVYMAASWYAEHPFGEHPPDKLNRIIATMLGPFRRNTI